MADREYTEIKVEELVQYCQKHNIEYKVVKGDLLVLRPETKKWIDTLNRAHKATDNSTLKFDRTAA
jgi:hypothetical protein